jgi:hypothetical protein
MVASYSDDRTGVVDGGMQLATKELKLMTMMEVTQARNQATCSSLAEPYSYRSYREG